MSRPPGSVSRALESTGQEDPTIPPELVPDQAGAAPQRTFLARAVDQGARRRTMALRRRNGAVIRHDMLFRRSVGFHGFLCHLAALLHEAELMTDAQSTLLAHRTACGRELQQRGHIEERERLELRGDHQDIGARVDVEPFGSAFLRVLPPPLEYRVVHDPHGGDRMAHAAPLVGVLRVDIQVGRSGVGDEEVATIGAEAQTMRIVARRNMPSGSASAFRTGEFSYNRTLWVVWLLTAIHRPSGLTLTPSGMSRYFCSRISLCVIA